MIMKRQKRLLPLIFFLLSVSVLFLSLSLLFLLSDGFRLRYTYSSSSSSSSSPSVPSLISEISPLLSLDGEILLPGLTTNESYLLDCSHNGDNSLASHPLPPPPPPPQPSEIPKFKLPCESMLLLRSTSRSRSFSKRAASFFNGDRPCKDRFFMTWLSSSKVFGRRELVAVDSLFNSHPDACLLIASNTMDSPHGAELLKPFTDRGLRAAAFSPDFAHLFDNTPAEQWFDRLRRGEVDPGSIALGQNLSNLLRLALLYKYGGTYMDTDVFVLRSFAGISNAIGAQSMDAGGNWTRLNSAVMIFDKKHPLIYKFIQEFAETFDGRKWGHNGPYMVSRVVEREEAQGRRGGVSVLQPRAFYPVDWNKIGDLFSGPKSEIHVKWIEERMEWIREESYALHLWNRQSKKMVVEEGSVIRRLMSKLCVVCNYSSTF